MEQEQPTYIKKQIDSALEDLNNLENQEFYHDMVTKPTKEEIGELVNYECKPSEFTKHLTKIPVDIRGKLIKEFEEEHKVLQSDPSKVLEVINSDKETAAQFMHVFAR